MAEYLASTWRIYVCPKCGFTDLYEWYSGAEYEEERRKRIAHLLTEKDTLFVKKMRKRFESATTTLANYVGAKQKNLSSALDVHYMLFGSGNFNDPKQLISSMRKCHSKMSEIIAQILKREGLNISNPEDQEKLAGIIKVKIGRIRKRKKIRKERR
jgi:selenocysteine lyase/cysteine desulfurase